MARHRRRRSYHGRGHRRHRFGDLSVGKVLRERASIKELGIGGVFGVLGALGSIYALNKYNASRAANKQAPIGFTTDASGNPQPAVWLPLLPAVGGVAAGAVAYFAQRKSKAKGMASLGAAGVVGLLVAGYSYAKAKYAAQFGDYVKVRLNGYGNVLVQQGALGNMLVTMPVRRAAGPGQFPASPSGRASMGHLALAAMSPAARAAGGYLRVR